jgi:hypothetical protein
LATEAIHCRRHFEFTKASSLSFFGRRVSRYPNSDSTFRIIRILTSWDVNLNSGPCTEKPKCHTCSRTIARNHRSLQCNSCGLKYHIRCGNVTPKLFNRIQSGDLSVWNCHDCEQLFISENISETQLLLSTLPFASVSNETFLSALSSDEATSISNQSCNEGEESVSHLTDLVRQLETCSSKSLRVAHLNVCSLRNKIEEVR